MRNTTKKRGIKMIPAGIQKYQRKSAQDRIIALLNQEKGNPLSIEDISFRLKLDEQTVRPIINNIQLSCDLCIKNGKIYFPKESAICWASVVGLIIIVAYTTWGIIKYYNL